MIILSSMTSKWIAAIQKIVAKCPTTTLALGKEWLFEEAQLAHPNSTAPTGASPVVAMLLEMVDDGPALAYTEKVFAEAHAGGPKRLKELKGHAAFKDGSAWQALAELSFYAALRSDGASVQYDQTEVNKRTPDFRREVAEEQVCIEHVAPGEGQYLKAKRREAEESLALAVEITDLFDEAKRLYDLYKELPPFTAEERFKIAKAHGKAHERGKSAPSMTDYELLLLIENHEIESVRSFSSAPYMASRSGSRAEMVRFLRQVKPGGTQVADCKWKVLGLSISDYMFSQYDVEEVRKTRHQNDPASVRWWSGVVWNALYGKPGDKLYGGIEEHLVQRGIDGRLTEMCDGFGLLVDQNEPWHAVVISLFSTKWHGLRAPGTARCGGDVLPLKLLPTRYLFLRRNGPALPEKVVTELTNVLEIRKVIR